MCSFFLRQCPASQRCLHYQLHFFLLSLIFVLKMTNHERRRFIFTNFPPLLFFCIFGAFGSRSMTCQRPVNIDPSRSTNLIFTYLCGVCNHTSPFGEFALCHNKIKPVFSTVFFILLSQKKTALHSHALFSSMPFCQMVHLENRCKTAWVGGPPHAPVIYQGYIVMKGLLYFKSKLYFNVRLVVLRR